MPNVWKVGVGYSGRRAIVDNAKCLACHAQLGVNPSFHVGQRNDGPTCSFCHTANQNSSGWSSNSKDFLHALHGARARSVPFMWQAGSFADVEYPNRLNNCVSCHFPGTYDFSAAASQTAIPNLLWSTVATGNLVAASVSKSPYVTATVYGAGFSYSASANTLTEAAGTTLVTSPVTAACIACHDSPAAFTHMSLNNGYFYAPRSNMPVAGAAFAQVETCLVCHNPGGAADIKVVHGQ